MPEDVDAPTLGLLGRLHQKLTAPAPARQIRILKQGGFVLLVIDEKGHKMTKADARRLGGLLHKAAL